MAFMLHIIFQTPIFTKNKIYAEESHIKKKTNPLQILFV